MGGDRPADPGLGHPADVARWILASADAVVVFRVLRVLRLAQPQSSPDHGRVPPGRGGRLPRGSAQAIFAPNGTGGSWHSGIPVALGDSKLLERRRADHDEEQLWHRILGV